MNFGECKIKIWPAKSTEPGQTARMYISGKGLTVSVPAR